MIEIRHKTTGAVLCTVDADTLHSADLVGADLRYADLVGADLRYANLEGAKLEGAKLEGAKLEGANLVGAKLPGFPGSIPATYAEAVEALIGWLTPERWLKGAWIRTPDGAYSGTCKACLHGAAAYVGGPVHGPAMTGALDLGGYSIASDLFRSRVGENAILFQPIEGLQERFTGSVGMREALEVWDDARVRPPRYR